MIIILMVTPGLLKTPDIMDVLKNHIVRLHVSDRKHGSLLRPMKSASTDNRDWLFSHVDVIYFGEVTDALYSVSNNILPEKQIVVIGLLLETISTFFLNKKNVNAREEPAGSRAFCSRYVLETFLLDTANVFHFL